MYILRGSSRLPGSFVAVVEGVGEVVLRGCLGVIGSKKVAAGVDEAKQVLHNLASLLQRLQRSLKN